MPAVVRVCGKVCRRGCQGAANVFLGPESAHICLHLEWPRPRRVHGARQATALVAVGCFVVASDLPKSPGHPFYTPLNCLLVENGFVQVVGSSVLPAMSRPSGDLACR